MTYQITITRIHSKINSKGSLIPKSSIQCNFNMFSIFKYNYSDADYIIGMKSGNKRIQSHFYNHCRDYFNQTYSKLFFTDKEQKNDIFEDSFIILWQKIERGDIYTENGIVMAKGGKQMKCSLKTFMMSIAWNKFREYTRKHRETLFQIGNASLNSGMLTMGPQSFAVFR